MHLVRTSGDISHAAGHVLWRWPEEIREKKVTQKDFLSVFSCAQVHFSFNEHTVLAQPSNKCRRHWEMCVDL